MRALRSLVLVALIGASASPLCSAQSRTGTASAPPRQLHFDLSVAGLNAGFALQNSSRTAIGGSIGVGGNWMNYMVLGGRHFSESDGLSYATKDGSTGKSLYELGRATVFARQYFAEGRQVDAGLKVSGFLHGDSSDDDLGAGTFIGLNVTGIWWQWRRLRIGSELDAGRYSEGRPEFGINVAPVLLRATFP